MTYGTVHPELYDAKWLTERYEKRQMTLEEIGKELGTSGAVVYRSLIRCGIQLRTPAQSRLLRGTASRRRFFQLDDKVWLTARYITDGMTTEEIGASIGCSHGPVLKALKKLGIPLRQAGLIRSGKSRTDRIDRLYDPVWLREQYIDKKRSPTEIAIELNCAETSVASALSDFNIRRSNQVRRGESRKDSNKNGYIRVWMPEHHRAIRGYAMRHNIIAEQTLGRELLPNEIVHHINEKRNDDRADNYIIMPNHTAHVRFHNNPPAWIPRCECCGRPRPELITARPKDVPLVFKG